MNNYLIKVKNMILSYWLYIMPHHLISRFTYIITRTHHPLTSFLIRLYVKLFKINLDECIDKNIENQMIEVIDKAKKSGDSVGGIFEVVASGIPYGLGSYTQWTEKLQSRISAMMMSINAFKGIEIGNGFRSASKFGSEGRS